MLEKECRNFATSILGGSVQRRAVVLITVIYISTVRKQRADLRFLRARKNQKPAIPKK